MMSEVLLIFGKGCIALIAGLAVVIMLSVLYNWFADCWYPKDNYSILEKAVQAATALVFYAVLFYGIYHLGCLTKSFF